MMNRIPEYSEYMRNISNGTPAEMVQVHAPVPLFANFPPIQLCRERPSDVYGHIFCWSMLAMFIMLIISMIIYQLRSFFWISNIKRNNHNYHGLELTSNGRASN